MTITCIDDKLDVYFQVYKNVNVVAIQFIVETGDMYENKKTLGMSHLLEHLLFESSPTYGNTLTDELNKRGISYNATTARDYVKYYFYAQSKYANFIINVVLDFLKVQNISEKEFQKEKKIVIEELKEIEDNPLEQLNQETAAQTYPNTILTRTIKDIIRNTELSTKRVVDTLHHQEYQLNKCFLVVCGNIHKKKIISNIYNRIYRLPLGKYTLPKLQLPHTFPIVKHISNTQIQKIYCTLQFINHDSINYYKTEVTCMYLKKRLFELFRRNSLAYGVNVYYTYTNYHTILHIEFNTNPDHFKRAFDYIFKEINKTHIQKKEYNIIHQDIQMSISKMTGQLDVNALAEYYSNLITSTKKMITPIQYYNKLLDVSTSQIEMYLSKHMNNIICITMGPETPSINI